MVRDGRQWSRAGRTINLEKEAGNEATLMKSWRVTRACRDGEGGGGGWGGQIAWCDGCPSSGPASNCAE